MTRYEDYGFTTWTDASAAISDFAAGFLQAIPEQNAETLREWAENGDWAIRDIRMCGEDPVWPAEWYQRWAGEHVAQEVSHD